MSERYPLHYYGGPFLRVGDPDRDMPVRDPAVPLTAQRRAHVESAGSNAGERLIPPFRDGNSTDDILAELNFALGYPENWDEKEKSIFPTIQGTLAVAKDRLHEKAKRTKGPQREWLLRAAESTRVAADAFAAKQYADGRRTLEECVELVAGASRNRRKRKAIQLGPRTEAS